MNILIKNVILDGKRQDVFIERNRIKKIGKKLNFKAKEKIASLPFCFQNSK